MKQKNEMPKKKKLARYVKIHPRSKYPKDAVKRVERYIHKHVAYPIKDKIPTIEELAIKEFDVSYSSLWRYAKKYKDFKRAIQKLKTVQRNRLVQRLIDGKNPVGAIFMLKAQHGFQAEADGKGGQRITIKIAPQLKSYMEDKVEDAQVVEPEKLKAKNE